MRTIRAGLSLAMTLLAGAAPAQERQQAGHSRPIVSLGRVLERTAPLPAGIILRSATYTPSGRVLVSYARAAGQGRRQLNLATMDDDGGGWREVWSGTLPERPKDNGVRYMVFPDDRRVFLGDFILECEGGLDACRSPQLLPVDYPPEVSNGRGVEVRWSEMIVAPDDRHIAWDTLFTGTSGGAVFTAGLRREPDRYRVVNADIISTLTAFLPDPRHRDGVIPAPVRGGEVKQFVHGGAAISLAGSAGRDIPDSVVQDLASGRVEAITDAPGYDETTIFSPDERLGLTMTSRFSPRTDPAILGLIPRPYAMSLGMGLSMYAYSYAVTGVRGVRVGNVGPALIDIAASQSQPGYLGLDLNADPDWIFYSPMSWRPDGKRGMWIEGHRGDSARRIRLVELPDYTPGPTVAVRPTPTDTPYGSRDLSNVARLADATGDLDVKVYGRARGYIRYRRTGQLIDKTYADFCDDGREVISGRETSVINPTGRSVYTADLRLTGPRPGAMALTMTFGPLHGVPQAELIFAPDKDGQPATRGYAEYGGRRLEADALSP